MSLSDLKPHVKLTIDRPEAESNSAFGPGIAALCRGVRDAGSLNAAAKNMGMAYSKATKAVTGVPSVANRSGTMTITVKSAGGSRSWEVKWRTVALDAFACGSFNGWTYVPSGEDVVRKVTVNVTGAGKITAKVGTLSLSRTGWTLGEDGFYRATLTKTLAELLGPGQALASV